MKYEIVIPWLISLISLIFSGIISIYIIKSSNSNSDLDRRRAVLSVNRQEWINTLRDLVSCLLKDINRLYEIEEKETAAFYYKKQEVHQQAIKLELLLNPSEEKSRLLIKYFRDISDALDPNFSGKETIAADLHQNIIDVTQKILKEEWDRVKKYV